MTTTAHNSQFSLPAEAVAQIQHILATHANIDKALLYGSRAMGTHRPGSDIDLTLVGNIPDAEIQQLIQELEETPLPYKFDVSCMSDIDNASLIDHIQRRGIVFYEK